MFMRSFRLLLLLTICKTIQVVISVAGHLYYITESPSITRVDEKRCRSLHRLAPIYYCCTFFSRCVIDFDCESCTRVIRHTLVCQYWGVFLKCDHVEFVVWFVSCNQCMRVWHHEATVSNRFLPRLSYNTCACAGTGLWHGELLASLHYIEMFIYSVLLGVWQCYSDLCWWSHNCLVFQGAIGPDGPTGESGLEGRKVSPLPSFNLFLFFFK